MDVKELMIGNYIHVCDEYPIEVLKIDLGNMCDIECSTDNDMFEPIPLTEDWLLKFGFLCEINNKDSGYKQYTLLKSIFNITFSIECNLSPECYLDNVGIEIWHVHQLQNLYFALTGKELSI